MEGGMIEVGSSEDRFYHRQRIWVRKHKHLPRVRHHGWWLAHNLVSHPWLGVSPSSRAIWFHDWTSKHLNQRDRLRPSPTPRISSRRTWLFHNVVGHVAIGLFPVDAAFHFHDYTAAKMAVPEWV
jgi:hypothetical protein